MLPAPCPQIVGDKFLREFGGFPERGWQSRGEKCVAEFWGKNRYDTYVRIRLGASVSGVPFFSLFSGPTETEVVDESHASMGCFLNLVAGRQVTAESAVSATLKISRVSVNHQSEDCLLFPRVSGFPGEALSQQCAGGREKLAPRCAPHCSRRSVLLPSPQSAINYALGHFLEKEHRCIPKCDLSRLVSISKILLFKYQDIISRRNVP